MTDDDPTADIKVTEIVDDRSIELGVKYDEPLSRIEQTESEWLLGSSHVGKDEPSGGTSWRSRFNSSTRFYTKKVTLPDGRVVLGIVFRILDRTTAGTPKEQLAGWVPIEREADALGWIAFLNSEIRRTVSRKPDEKTDADHYCYMLEHGGRINGIVEAEDSWGHGGNLWIAKGQPLFKVGPNVLPLRESTHYYASKFTAKVEGTSVTGWALWFQPDPADASRYANGRVLCGWTDDENKVTSWVDFLNQQIRARLDEAASQPAPTEAEREAAAARHFQHSMAMFRKIGVPMPDAENVDDFVTRLEQQNKEGPIDNRSRVDPNKKK